MDYCVYILYSEKLNRYYIGETVDLENRINEHNTGLYGNSFTSKTGDWEIFISISCSDRIQARKIETHIKKMKSIKYIQDLKRYPEIVLRLKKIYT